MRFLGVAVILAIVGVLLVSSGVATVGPPIGPANAGPAPAADAQPVVARSRPEVQRSVLEDHNRDAALELLLLGMLRVGAAGRFAGDRSLRLAWRRRARQRCAHWTRQPVDK